MLNKERIIRSATWCLIIAFTAIFWICVAGVVTNYLK